MKLMNAAGVSATEECGLVDATKMLGARF